MPFGPPDARALPSGQSLQINIMLIGSALDGAGQVRLLRVAVFLRDRDEVHHALPRRAPPGRLAARRLILIRLGRALDLRLADRKIPQGVLSPRVDRRSI